MERERDDKRMCAAAGRERARQSMFRWNENDETILRWYKVFTTYRRIHRSTRLFGWLTCILSHTYKIFRRALVRSLARSPTLTRARYTDTHTHTLSTVLVRFGYGIRVKRVFKHALMQANVRVNINVNNMRIEEEPFTRSYYYMHLINKYTGTNRAMPLNECIKNGNVAHGGNGSRTVDEATCFAKN